MHQIETGKIYRNRNGSDYRCLGIDNIGNPIMQHTTSKWTFTAHKINMYPDGTIEWSRSTGGRFVPDNQKNAAADNRQQQKKKLKLALEKYGIPRDVYIDCPGSQKGAQSKVLEAVEVIQGERYSSLGAARLEYSSRELFEFWLQYEGLIGYATPILSVLKALNDYDSNAATAGLSYNSTAAEIKAALKKISQK